MYYTNDYSMNPNDYNIPVSSPLAKEADALFHEMGVDMSEAVNSFLRQTILRHGFPFTVEDPTLFTKGEMMEKLRRSDADIEAGRVVRVTDETIAAFREIEDGLGHHFSGTTEELFDELTMA